jgi:hypothetical protein
MVVHLAEAASEELDKAARDISRPRLQSLLELAVRTSSLAQVGYGMLTLLITRSLSTAVRLHGRGYLCCWSVCQCGGDATGDGAAAAPGVCIEPVCSLLYFSVAIWTPAASVNVTTPCVLKGLLPCYPPKDNAMVTLFPA